MKNTASLDRLFVFGAIICGFSLFGQLAMGQTTWTNTGTGSWADAGNWNNGLPTSSVHPTITNSGTAVLSTGVSGAGMDLQLGIAAGEGGALLINGGGLVLRQLHAGVEANSQGSVVVSSGTLQSELDLNVGLFGSGTLNVSGGTVGVGVIFRVGGGAGGNGTANITGGAVSAEVFSVGQYGTGGLSISGGNVNGGLAAHVGEYAGGLGTMSVSGGTFVTRSLNVGTSGTGTLNISGGVVTVNGTPDITTNTGTATIGANSDGVGVIRVTGSSGGRGVLEARRIVKGAGTASLEVDGGVLRALDDESDYLSGFKAGDVIIGPNGMLIETNSFAIGISTALGGSGRVIKEGAGVLTLSGSNSYGQTYVLGGTLLINGDNSGADQVLVGSGAVLGGTGTVSDVALSGGTIAPGNSPGLFTIQGNLLLDNASTVIMEFNGDGPGEYDQLSVGGTMLMDGVLTLVFNYTPVIGESFDIIIGDPTWVGEFDVVSSNLGGGLMVDDSLLATTGTITIVPEPSAGALVVLAGTLIFARRKRDLI